MCSTWRMPSSGILCCVALVRAYVSEERIASIVRVLPFHFRLEISLQFFHTEQSPSLKIINNRQSTGYNFITESVRLFTARPSTSSETFPGWWLVAAAEGDRIPLFYIFPLPANNRSSVIARHINYSVNISLQNVIQLTILFTRISCPFSIRYLAISIKVPTLKRRIPCSTVCGNVILKLGDMWSGQRPSAFSSIQHDTVFRLICWDAFIRISEMV
jgi:hypothetical protein